MLNSDNMNLIKFASNNKMCINLSTGYDKAVEGVEDLNSLA
jgi:hypothetical protein